jgi:hypothetical protein
MSQFYFHVRSNGRLAEDSVGRSYHNRDEACAYALQSMPQLLKEGLQRDNTYVSTEVRDETQTVGVVRTTIILELRGQFRRI